VVTRAAGSPAPSQADRAAAAAASDRQANPTAPGKHETPDTPQPARAEPGDAPRFAQVAVPVPLRRLFTYHIPETMRNRVAVGSLVRIPFGRRKTTGFVVDLAAASDLPAIKDLDAVEDPDLSLPADVLDLCRWVSDYYLAPLGEVLRAALPAGLGKKTPGDVPRAEGPAATDLVLGPEQAQALTAVLDTLRRHEHATHLLYGVTGSGKTEVYLRAAQEAVKAGGKVLLLIPEIALSPQMVRRVEARFGNRAALWHSALTPARRREVWTRTRRGEIDVLVGARSAVFAPLPDLRLVVVDEEHENAYKQAESPRYHARDVALVRARAAGATVILGSATPSLESFANAERGKHRLLTLPHRVERRPRAPVELVAIPRADDEPRPLSLIFGNRLREAMAATLSRGEQSILFLNRRGHSTLVLCEACREPLKCSQCDITLTWHQVGDRVVCHYCGRKRKPPADCPECGGPVTIFKGVGTQRVMGEIARLFAGVRVLRLDTDSTRKRGALETALETFRRGEADILLGTQMVAKGLDFPRVTLVGVVNADIQLALPDFRSAERTFQLLTQVAGRSGRGERPGTVIFQTHHPEHYALVDAAAQDYEAFYRTESESRTDPPYPPHVRLVNLMFDGKDRDAVERRAEQAAATLQRAIRRQGRAVEILGPAPQPFSRLKGKHRWHVTLRGTDRPALRALALAVLEQAETAAGGAVRTTVDVDPVSLL